MSSLTFMVGTLPKGFISKNHWGLDRKFTLMVSYGIFLASKTKTVRWAKGQNLMLTKDTLAESKVGHSDEASKCFDHDAIFQAEIRLVDLGALLMQLQASCGITTCLVSHYIQRVQSVQFFKTQMLHKTNLYFSYFEIKWMRTHCLKITQNVAFEFLNFGIFHQFLSY